MKNDKIYLGKTLLSSEEKNVRGEFVNIQGEKFYKISNCDQMADFFMTIVSDADHWMFISSNGSLSAGRKDRNNALFPYYTDDKITDYCGITGSKTIVFVEKNDKAFLWEPFSKELSHAYNIERNLYKSQYGDKIIFEEYNVELGVSFEYGWSTSDDFGFIKKSVIRNLSSDKVNVKILDGITNILPQGVDHNFQNEYSNLLDGYKKNELLEATGLGLFMLSSIPVDRAEPSESLNATTVWSAGLTDNKTLVSSNQLENFRKGLEVNTETDVRASRGSYFVNTELAIESHQDQEWIIVADVNRSSTDVANLNQWLKNEKNVLSAVQSNIEQGTQNLIRIVANADGLQSTREEMNTVRHFSNTMFNVMRGGIYLDGYNIEKTDFRNFVNQTNKSIYEKFESVLNDLPESLSNAKLIEIAEKMDSADFIRICNEYLPLTFSRRHGDPSRPWNQFSIDNRNEDGSLKSDFQGNWRDIFQNWEALSLSYPGYIENIISKFLNASTPDGYNPYRIMRNGIDWESPDPDDPWAYIGYWGDHQIIYLQKLLELSNNYHPGKLDEMLTKEIFVFANVPYRIKSYKDIVSNPKDTIDFDGELNKKIDGLVAEFGADGRLLMDSENQILHVNLTEKILVTLLSKLSNFIPEAGIWLNTQRPEWNDANNALVGNGVSMVTLYYLRRFLKFWYEKFSKTTVTTINISEEVYALLTHISNVFSEYVSIVSTGFSDIDRRKLSDALGKAGENYREAIYSNSFSGNKKTVNATELAEFVQLALKYIDQSILVNKREDGLFHAYNLVSFDENGISIRYLYEMLEGQVAVLSSGLLSVSDCLAVFDALKNSKLFRSDQYSYLLYPDRQLARFEDKNNIPINKVNESQLLSKLVEEKDTSIIAVDNSGGYHFNGSFRNADEVAKALDALDSDQYGELLKSERSQVLDIYEEMFDHQSFTGRSGTFYAYEGLGSIYWHMVSKLLLVAEECYFQASDEGAGPGIIGGLRQHYYEIKAGIGLYKSPELYGAFPTDAYSHTPGHAGAKQPGMTGQVKEDFISRMGELGVRIIDGEIVFDSALLNPNEFIEEEHVFEYVSEDGQKHQIPLKSRQLGFTFCQKPLIYSISDHENIKVFLTNGEVDEINGNAITKELSGLIFNRSKKVERIEVAFRIDGE